MRLSRYLLPTLKELPADADTVSARLMLRAGMIRKVASGLYEWLPFGLKVLRKVERVVREEMDRVGGQEVLLPFVQPKDLWQESGRWQAYGKEMMRLKDRKDTEFCLAPTAEEVITDLVRREVRSYRELPLLLYQFGTKFRDEIRPRFGVMRAREFYMKDAYSFHADEASAEATYRDVYAAYTRIFARCGLRFRPVEADTGTIGGAYSHEFMVLADTGEETIASCTACGYAANLERAESAPLANDAPEALLAVEDVATPGAGAVEDVARLLKVEPRNLIKTLVFVSDGKPVAALVRGDRELNEPKLRRALGAAILHKANDEAYRQATGCAPGYGGPMNLTVPLVADPSVMGMVNAISGANRTDTHRKNVNPGRDFTPSQVADIQAVQERDPCPKCKQALCFSKGIEVGHVFKLGTKYSAAMNAGYLNEKGAKTPFVMGCYGIGVSRVVAAAIEQCHDENGMVWPASLAPFDVVLLPLNVEEPRLMAMVEQLERDLGARGVEVLVDDRDQRAGVKFKDADLLGIPWRITLGEKKAAQGMVELKSRASPESVDVPIDQAVTTFLAHREKWVTEGGRKIRELIEP